MSDLLVIPRVHFGAADHRWCPPALRRWAQNHLPRRVSAGSGYGRHARGIGYTSDLRCCSLHRLRMRRLREIQ